MRLITRFDAASYGSSDFTVRPSGPQYLNAAGLQVSLIANQPTFNRKNGFRKLEMSLPFGLLGNCAAKIFNWRTREDSNLWPLPSEGSALSG